MTEDLGVTEKYPHPTGCKRSKRGTSFASLYPVAKRSVEGRERGQLKQEEILRPSAEILSANLTTNAQNDKIKSPLPPFKKGGKKVAFTLAEVLVTLGIIGVVAAMTLPMLAENYQRRVVETRLKKFYTTFNQAILRSVDVNGPYEGWNYWVESRDKNGVLVAQPEAISMAFNLYLRPYLSVIQEQKVIYTDGTSTTLYYLSDGSAFAYHVSLSRDMYYFPKKPVECLKLSSIQRGGVCQFTFEFNPLGLMNRVGNNPSNWKHLKDKGLEPFKFKWNGNVEQLYTAADYGCKNGTAPQYCAAIIQYNNWEFPADYPRKIRY